MLTTYNSTLTDLTLMLKTEAGVNQLAEEERRTPQPFSRIGAKEEDGYYEVEVRHFEQVVS